MPLRVTSIAAEVLLLVARIVLDVSLLIFLVAVVAPLRLIRGIVGMETPRKKYKSIFISGASQGLGAAMGEAFAAPGVFLCLSSIESERAVLDVVRQRCEAKGARVRVEILDVRDGKSCSDLLDDLCTSSDPLDLVISNAGISPPPGRGVDDLKLVFDVNITGTCNIVAPVLKHFIPRRSGHLVLVSSLGGYSLPASETMTPYVPSKQAVRTLASGLRTMFTPTFFHVSCVLPGMVDTAMTREQRAHGAPLDNYMMVSASDAAQFIREGVECGDAEIAFPLPIYIASRIQGNLPVFVTDLLRPIFRRTDPFAPLDPRRN